VLDALFEVTGSNPINPDMLEKIMIITTSGAQKNDVGTSYDNIHSAQMSLPYAVAVKIHDGLVGVEQFSSDKINDDRIRKIAERVEIVVDPELDKMGLDHRLAAKAILKFKNGELKESNIIRNPYRMTNEESLAKFYNLSKRVIGKDSADEIVGFVKTLESRDNIIDLAHMLTT
jgi:2-methylcitrate dehydratase PrpD